MNKIKQFFSKIKDNVILLLSNLLYLITKFFGFLNLYIIKESLKIIILLLLTGGICYSYWFTEPKNEIEYEYAIYRSQTEMNFYAAKKDAVYEIDKYIDSVAPLSNLHGIAVLEACNKYNLDIVFVLAQAQLESHFGTTGIASKTNSVWNVMAYDGRSARDMNKRGHGFKHPDFSIVPYMKLLNKRYLSDNKTEYDLMVKFEDNKGHRYASDKTYEKRLTGIYNRIMEKTKIFDKYQEYNKYKMILQVNND